MKKIIVLFGILTFLISCSLNSSTSEVEEKKELINKLLEELPESEIEKSFDEDKKIAEIRIQEIQKETKEIEQKIKDAKEKMNKLEQLKKSDIPIEQKIKELENIQNNN